MMSISLLRSMHFCVEGSKKSITFFHKTYRTLSDWPMGDAGWGQGVWHTVEIKQIPYEVRIENLRIKINFLKY